MREGSKNGDDRRGGRIVKSATEARQGEVVLGQRGIWIWIAVFVVIVVLAILGT
jgi:hypothetical protein